jgi:hypothetical protein
LEESYFIQCQPLLFIYEIELVFMSVIECYYFKFDIIIFDQFLSNKCYLSQILFYCICQHSNQRFLKIDFAIHCYIANLFVGTNFLILSVYIISYLAIIYVINICEFDV